MAEIRQKIISCAQGHYYDANRYASCPYCSSGGFTPTEDPFSKASGAIGKTMDIDPIYSPDTRGREYYEKVERTSPPYPDGGASDQMGKTQFVDTSTPAGVPAPVVGWLVAVSGPSRGTDYRIHAGYNYIGRERGDICIRGDNTISAEKDANVTYVPQTRQFFIAHEQGKNVLLVNDLPVIGGGMQLHNFDRITVGSTQLVFVGLCGEQFTWSGEGQNHG